MGEKSYFFPHIDLFLHVCLLACLSANVMSKAPPGGFYLREISRILAQANERNGLSLHAIKKSLLKSKPDLKHCFVHAALKRGVAMEKLIRTKQHYKLASGGKKKKTKENKKNNRIKLSKVFLVGEVKELEPIKLSDGEIKAIKRLKRLPSGEKLRSADVVKVLAFHPNGAIKELETLNDGEVHTFDYTGEWIASRQED